MDLMILIAIATSLLVIIITLLYFKSKSEPQKVAREPQQRGVPARAAEGVPRRAQIVRNQRNRARVVEDEPVAADDDDDTERPMPDFDGKMGAKKRAKLEAKEEKKKQREAEQQAREEQKAKDAIIEAERQKQQQEEEALEKAREEAERKAREEKERREHEEYLKMKEAFSVEEEGYDEEEESDNLLQEFVKYIKENKVVVIEDVAAHFKLKTQATIDRIKDLQKDDIISGVIDDRGKFIYISPDELKSVAKFIRQRGRVSITELAEHSNKLINFASPIAASQ
ncbi:DDRGK domain-containing protein 1 [Culicoides brevitarsis]|uniref:DDRGK domain-containing protein 1 n=1 Tax=Culicoides brevitarsis TaxID=469753 RepID=UPI00307C9B1A